MFAIFITIIHEMGVLMWPCVFFSYNTTTVVAVANNGFTREICVEEKAANRMLMRVTSTEAHRHGLSKTVFCQKVVGARENHLLNQNPVRFNEHLSTTFRHVRVEQWLPTY